MVLNKLKDIRYLGIFSYIIGAIVLCAFMLICGYFLGGRSYSRSKNVPFESGVESINNSKVKYPIRFYLIAMFFVIFDMEGVYIYIWSISIRETGWVGFFEICIFIIVLLVSLIYLIRMGVFDWVKKISKSHDHYICNLDVDVSKFLKDNNKINL